VGLQIPDSISFLARQFGAIRKLWAVRDIGYFAQLQSCNSEKATMSDNIAIQFRAKRDLYNRLENWRREQDRIPPVADAARHLIERGLDAVASTKSKSKEKGVAA
jgi:hypothetical protein